MQEMGLQSRWAALKPDQLVPACTLLAQALTIAARGEYPPEIDDAPPEETLRAVKSLVGFNEVQHQVTNQLVDLTSGREGVPRDEFVTAIRRHAELRGCSEPVRW